jgi:hypothetical protein
MPSPFASRTVSDPIPLPFDAGQWIQVRTLTARECDTCRQAHAAGIAAGDARLWPMRFRRILEGSVSDKALVDQAIADPLTGWDRFSLVRLGLVAWSYPQSIAIMPGTPAAMNPDGTTKTPAIPAIDHVGDLVDEAVDFFATAVLRKTKPGLFLTTEEDIEAAQKHLPGPVPPA